MVALHEEQQTKLHNLQTQEKEKNIKRQNTAPLICSSSSTIPYVGIFRQPHPAQQSSICLGLHQIRA
jgi:hypothetical protein